MKIVTVVTESNHKGNKIEIDEADKPKNIENRNAKTPATFTGNAGAPIRFC